MSALPAVELLGPSADGRRFEAERTVRLGDVDREGLLRFDAIGRYLQDVASDDALDAGLPNALGWVVRRTLIRTTHPASAGEAVRLTTFCSGAGPSWAERRTVLESDVGARVDAVSLWVQLDVATGRPARLGPAFFELYGPAAAGRRISAKLSLPVDPPGPVDSEAEWRFRRSDVDQFGHVNNAAQLCVVEEFLVGPDRFGDLEIEYLSPAEAGVALTVDTSRRPDDGSTLMRVIGSDGSVATVVRRRPGGQAQPSSSGIGRS